VSLEDNTVRTIAGTNGVAGFQDGSSNTLTYPTTIVLAEQMNGLYIVSDAHPVIRVYFVSSDDESFVTTVSGFNQLSGRTEPIHYKNIGLSSDAGAFKQSVYGFTFSDMEAETIGIASFYDVGNCVIKKIATNYPIVAAVNFNPVCYGKFGIDACGGTGECVGYNTCVCSYSNIDVTDTCFGKTKPVLSTIIAGTIPNPLPQSGIPTSGAVSDNAIDTPTAVAICNNKRVISENTDALYFDRPNPEQFDTVVTLTNVHVYPYSVEESTLWASSCIAISKKLNAIYSFAQEYNGDVYFDIYKVAGNNGTAGDKDGIDSELNGPTRGVFVYNFMVFSDTNNHKIKMIMQGESGYNTFTIAGSNAGFRDGYGEDALFNEPRGMYYGR
jgi:hypothetical protein